MIQKHPDSLTQLQIEQTLNKITGRQQELLQGKEPLSFQNPNILLRMIKKKYAQ